MKIALVKAPAGLMDKLHRHPEANQYVLRLTGDSKWAFNITPKGEVHGGADLKEETIALFIWDGPRARLRYRARLQVVRACKNLFHAILSIENLSCLTPLTTLRH